MTWVRIRRIIRLTLVGATTMLCVAPAVAQSPPPGPVAGTVMTPQYASAIAKLAYVWGWPLVNLHNRREAYRQVQNTAYVGGAPVAPINRLIMYTDYVDPRQRLVAHPNQDVVYGAGVISPDRGAAVLQVPDFGDRFWVYQLADQRTDGFANVGKMYGTRPGHYLIVGPDWKGEVPKGISAVFTLRTSMGVVLPRVFMADTAEDRVAVQSAINGIAMYPLSEYDGTMKVVDWKRTPSVPAPATTAGEIKWVVPARFFDQLGAVLDEVPPLPGEESLYAQFRALLATAAADADVKAAIVRAAEEAEREIVDPLFQLKHVGVRLPEHWTRSVNGAAFGTDYLNRLALAKSNIFVNQNRETIYFYQYSDADGLRLNGANRYSITFNKEALPPVRGFWSLTLYNRDHFFDSNELNRHSIGTKNRSMQYGADGSLTIYVQRERPHDGQVSNWLPASDGEFAITLRAYWPDEAILKGTWTPPAFRKLK